MFLRSLATAVCCTLLAAPALAQDNMAGMNMDKPSKAPLPSPAAIADVTLNGKAIKITYNTPSIRGRKIMGGLVPYGEVWRTGANPATTLITAANLKIGTLTVPAGTYTLYTLPNADQWLLIVNKQTGQWGTVYNQDQDLGRTPMTGKTLPAPQEKMSISFEHTHSSTTELHVKWETTDEFVTVTAQ
jgi:Protein of unknown function (DUF2911)